MAASLFGPTPAELIMAQQKEAQQMQMLRNQQMAQQGQQFGVFAPLYQAGLKLGDVGAQAAMQGLFPQQADPRLQQATAIQSVLAKYADEDQSDPEVLTKIGKDLMSVAPEAGLRALTMAKELAPKGGKISLSASDLEKIDPKDRSRAIQSFQTTGKLPDDISFIDKAKNEAPRTKAERDYLDSIYAKYPNTTEGRAAAANEFAEWLSSFKQQEARAGVPGVGEVKISDLSSAVGIVDRFVKGPQERLGTANAARTQLNLAKRGSGPAFAQLQRQLVKLVGDNQISNQEVRSALGRAGIVGDTIDAVNMFMTGTPSRDKLGAVEQVINALEANAASAYNEGRAKASSVLRNAKLSPDTIDDLIPSVYKTAAQKQVEAQAGRGPAVGTIEQGYRFKGGNPADSNNWEKVK
jgi:hypothetical protein